MTFGSLFSGAGGFDIGFDRAGLKCRWQVEIDKQAQSVLRKHYRRVPKFSDVRDVGGHNLKPVDCIIGGSPCQGFSVAGAMAGVEDERSGLFTEMVRVVDELKPKYVVWENVPGVASGFDEVLADEHYELFSWAERRALTVEAGGLIRLWWLGAVLRSFADIGYGGAYRILDARWFGVPQRRRRIFAVFVRQSRGDSGTRRAAEILALTEGVRRNPAKGREAGKDVAGTLGGGSGSRGWSSDTERMTFVPLAGTLNANGKAAGSATQQDAESGLLIAHTLRAEGFDASEDGTGRGTPLVPVGFTNRGVETGCETETLRAASHGAIPMAFNWNASNMRPGSISPTVRAQADCGSGQPAVAFAQNTRDEVREIGNGLVGALPAQPGMKQQSYISGASHGVRRLTPRECERLMSWPDDWTRYGHDGREMADGPRYRMCGNGVVSNVAEWLGRRLMEVQR